MSRLNHSPGPWKLFPLPEASRIQIETTSGHVVCEVHTYPHQRAPKANAQFISAAPDMFEFLLAMRSILSEEIIGATYWSKLNAAIDKATKPI